MNKCVRIIFFFLSRRELGMPVIAPADSVQLPWLTLVNGRVPGVRRWSREIAFNFVAILYLTLRCQLKWIICTTKTKSRLSSPQVTSNLLLLLRFVVESWSKATGHRNVFPRLAMYGWLGYPVIFCWASWALICIQFHSCMCVTSNACEVNKPLATPSSFPKIWQWNS